MRNSVSAQELKRLRYGTTISTVNLPVWVAKESRLFAKHGLDPEVIMIQAGALTTLAIISGELQFSGAGAASVLAARIKGSDITLVACPADSDLVYLMARPEIKSAAELKGKSSAVTRLGSTTHFYLRAALKYAGLNPEKDVTILQLGTEYAAALETGRIAAAALPFDLALPYLQRGWPILLDLSKTDFVYPASCVVSSRAFVKDNPDTVERFLKAYIEAIHLMKKDHSAGERAYNRWLKPKEPLLAKRAVEAYANCSSRFRGSRIGAFKRSWRSSRYRLRCRRSSSIVRNIFATMGRWKNWSQRLDRSAQEIALVSIHHEVSMSLRSSTEYENGRHSSP